MSLMAKTNIFNLDFARAAGFIKTWSIVAKLVINKLEGFDLAHDMIQPSKFEGCNP